MSFFTSTTDKIEMLLRRIEHTPRPTHQLICEIIETVCPHHLCDRGDRSVQMRRWLDADSFVQIAFALVDWELPDWLVRRVAQENRVWWCAIAHRHMIDWGGEEEDECHEDMTLAVLKSFLTVLCHLPGEHETAIPPRPLAARRPAPSAGDLGSGPHASLYEILIKKLGAPSRSFMRQVK